MATWIVAAAVLTGIGAAPAACGSSPSGTAPAFTISGDVSGLYPGASLPLHLTVLNRERFPIVVTSITTSVSDAGALCAGSNLSVTSFNGTLTLPAGGVNAVTVSATMLPSAPDACQGHVFPLQYRGAATRP